jgi:hypothetical protein
MNNNLYSWHDEQMVRHEIRKVDHAVRQARLLKEMGGSDVGLLATRNVKLQERQLGEPQVHARRCDTLA